MPNMCSCQEMQGRYGAVEATQKETYGYQGLEVINHKGDEPARRVRRQAVQARVTAQLRQHWTR